jgi:hypothetical protein
MITVLEISPNPQDACSYYRSRGPLSNISLQGDIRLMTMVPGYPLSWADLSLCNIVFMQRPASKDSLEIVKLALQMGKPVWVDYDDDLTDVPMYNQASTYYRKKEIQDSILGILERATLVTVTTDFLAGKLSQWARDVRVIPNALDIDYRENGLFRMQEFVDNKLVIWRGSHTHYPDMYHYSKAINSITKDSDFEFIFIGFDAPFLKHRDNTSFMPPMPIHNYLCFLREAKASYGIVILSDSDFNRSKSNIAWMELTANGAMVLAPGFSEWMQPNITSYNTENWEHIPYQFSEMINDNNKAGKQRLALEKIKEKYNLRNWNSYRLQLIKELVLNNM